jgi:TetR/AcrR family transcriptional repressor of nem operon
LSGSAVAAVMKASGLTHGGFYKHFRSKDDLLVEAISDGMKESGCHFVDAARRAPPGEGWKELVKAYLSIEHCENAAMGCPLATLAPELARAKPALKKKVTAVMIEHRTQLLGFMPGRTQEEKEKTFVVIFSSMAGAMAMARIFPEKESKARILNSMREHLLSSF